jgi:hypothetical protein
LPGRMFQHWVEPRRWARARPTSALVSVARKPPFRFRPTPVFRLAEGSTWVDTVEKVAASASRSSELANSYAPPDVWCLSFALAIASAAVTSSNPKMMRHWPMTARMFSRSGSDSRSSSIVFDRVCDAEPHKCAPPTIWSRSAEQRDKGRERGHREFRAADRST